jgi:hypothetical protein
VRGLRRDQRARALCQPAQPGHVRLHGSQVSTGGWVGGARSRTGHAWYCHCLRGPPPNACTHSHA